ncbi:hypothetical protein WJX82_010112 [Trebouxia sp. C0006]
MSGQHSPGFDCRPGTTVIQLACLTLAMPVLQVASLSRYNRDNLPARLTAGLASRAAAGAVVGRRAPKASSQASMLLEGLTVSPTVDQSHVGFLSQAPLRGQPPSQRPATHAQTISPSSATAVVDPNAGKRASEAEAGSQKSDKRAAENLSIDIKNKLSKFRDDAVKMHRSESSASAGTADDGRQAREHGCGDVLPELGPAIIPQQAPPASALKAVFMSWLPLSRIKCAAKNHQAGNWIRTNTRGLKEHLSGSTGSRRFPGQHPTRFDCRPGKAVIQLVSQTPAMPVTRVASLFRDDLLAHLT